MTSTSLRDLTRRDFLKLAAAGLLGTLLSGLRLEPALADELSPDQQGRVTANTIDIYDVPSTKGNFVNSFWRDPVFAISSIAISDDDTAANRIWYQVDGRGYAHSAFVQPVRTLLNKPAAGIPELGCLAELTVPYTDVHAAPDPASKIGYRIYYGTTYWLMALAQAPDGSAWYKIWDEKRKQIGRASCRERV